MNPWIFGIGLAVIGAAALWVWFWTRLEETDIEQELNEMDDTHCPIAFRDQPADPMADRVHSYYKGDR